MGQSRSTTAALFFLMRKASMSQSKALEMIKRRRPAAEPIPAFREILGTYEAKCEKERESTAAEAKKRAGGDCEDDKGKEKRRKAGPSIGPSIGPQVGPQKIGPSIGPRMMGPSTKKAPTTKKVIGPSMPPAAAKTSIGPSLPPSSVSSKDVSNSSTTKKTIGPSLPPS